MDTQEFRKDFMENIKAVHAATGEGSCASFVSSFAEYLQEAEVLMDFTASFYQGTGKQNKKYRVDGYAFDEFDKTMSLVIADYTADEERVFGKTQAEQLKERLAYFADQALNGTLYREIEMSTPCADLVDLLRDKKSTIQKYKLFIFTTASMSASIKTLDAFEIDGKSAECQIWDVERLFKVCASDTGRDIIEIDFTEYIKQGLPCLEASDTTTEFKSYLCIIPGSLLADIYDKYGSGLLEGNVRSFLSTKVAVNKKIRETIMRCPERFFAYNNGISATAMNIRIEATPQGRFLVAATDFQIINGGQTTASLSSARFQSKDADLSAIYVQMKLTVIEETLEGKAAELVQNISKSSNSQNKVSEADFFSTHPFHVRMERFSQRLYAKATAGAQYETKWFYERARGQFLQKQMRMTAAQKRQFLLQNPKSQLITKTDLAKVRNTWKGRPHVVSKGAQTNFVDFADATSREWDDNDNGVIFNEKYFRESVALVLIFRYTETMVGKQSWYAQGYRANIVTYTIALLHKLIQQQFPGRDLDLMDIWNRQAVPEEVQIALTELSELVYYRLTDDNRPIENVTQWCKREQCWKSVQEIDYRLLSGIEVCLVSKSEQKAAEKEAKMDQQIMTDVEIQAKVFGITAEQWGKASIFAQTRKLITADEHTILRIASQIPAKFPTPAQCKRLLDVLNRLETEGFKL